MSLTEAFSQIKESKALVIGDLMVDVYTMGSVGRISPEAPVPVLHVMEERALPGGAANVALNLAALGSTVHIVGRIGDDANGGRLRALLEENNLSVEGVFVQKSSVTPLKNRYIAGGQQLIRTDYEKIEDLESCLEEEIKQLLSEIIPTYDIIALSDYGKGMLSHTLLLHIMKEARRWEIRVIVDPKGIDITKYAGAFLIKPNAQEAYATAGLGAHASLTKVAAAIFDKIDLDHLLVTRSEKGMTLFSKNDRTEDFPVEKRDVLDVTGAGDTALAMLTYALSCDIELSYAIELANIASGLAIARLGCAAIKLSEVAHALLQRDSMSKCFDDEDNLFVLHKALEYCDIIALHLSGEQEMSSALFQLIKQIFDRKQEAKLVVILSGSDVKKEFASLLASMREVDFVVIQKRLYQHLIKTLAPIEIIEAGALVY